MYASVLLDGSSGNLGGQDIVGVPHDQLHSGMRVRAVWKPKNERSAEGVSNRGWGSVASVIDAFEWTGEPDADRVRLRGAHLLMAATDIAVVGFAQTPSVRKARESEVQLLVPIVTEALERAGLDRREVGFTCAGSCDYLTGGPFAFVSEPRSRGRVAADLGVARRDGRRVGAVRSVGAVAARRHRHRVGVRLRQVVAVEARRDVGAATRPVLPRAAGCRSRRRSPVSRRARCSTRARRPSATSPKSSCATGATRRTTRTRRWRATTRSTRCSKAPYVRAPLRAHDFPPISDGAVAVVLARGDRARALCERPAWIRGLDHRIEVHQPGMRDLTSSTSTTLAARKAGYDGGPLDVVELSSTFSPQELILREALGLDGRREREPVGRRARRPTR